MQALELYPWAEWVPSGDNMSDLHTMDVVTPPPIEDVAGFSCEMKLTGMVIYVLKGQLAGFCFLDPSEPDGVLYT